MKTLAALVDVPTDQTGAPTSRTVVAKFGDYQDKRYGKFSITPAMAADWKNNLSSVFGGKVAVDLDHSPEKRGTSEAAGWITGLDHDDQYVYADVDWTPLGKSAISEKRYLFVSPTYSEDYEDETGAKHGHALVGMGLTNRPVLRQGMPTLNLSREEFVSADDFALAVVSVTDSRPAMSDLTKTLGLPDDADEQAIATAVKTLAEAKPVELIKTLSLPEDADDAAVLTAVKALAAKNKPDEKTLVVAATEAGKVLLDQATFDTLNAKLTTLDQTVASLNTLTAERASEKFTLAWDEALREGRAAPATKEHYEGLYGLDAGKTLALLAAAPRIVPVRPTGSSANHETPPNVSNPAEYELDQAVHARMTADKLDYVTALDREITERAMG